MRYFLEFAYNGTRFHGYQIQPNGITVQETIEQALSTILSEAIKITGCGRTDTGVHAAQYFAHFDSTKVSLENLIYKLNSFIFMVFKISYNALWISIYFYTNFFDNFYFF